VTRAKISEYSATAGDNTDVNGVNIAEGCPPSSMNNMGREIMAALKRFQTGTDGDPVTIGGQLAVTGTTTTSPAIVPTGDTNTGIFFPAADTIAFAEGGAEAMRIDSSGNVGIGNTSPSSYEASGDNLVIGTTGNNGLTIVSGTTGAGTIWFADGTGTDAYRGGIQYAHNGDSMRFNTAGDTERMRINSSGNVGIGTTSPAYKLDVEGNINNELIIRSHNTNSGNVATARLYAKNNNDSFAQVTTYSSNFEFAIFGITAANYSSVLSAGSNSNGLMIGAITADPVIFGTSDTERARITSGGQFLVGQTTNNSGVAGHGLDNNGFVFHTRGGGLPLYVNRLTNDGNLVELVQDNVTEGAISVSGNTVTYGAFCGGHWTQLQEGRGYNPNIPRGTVMSSIGEMAVWKSVEWVETVEHPAIEAVEAVEAVLNEDGNVIEPAVEAVEGKEAWTESIPHRESYLGNLDIGATFEEDGFTKTVVDDGNERLPKVKISDVVGDKAVYGVFQTWDEVEDMLISSLGAFVVRIASGVTVEVGDLLESNGDGCAKVQDDDIIRSKTIGKVTSTVATDTYDDGSYTVPCVLYCG
jgi:hypothetical protein